jgi:predicted amidohydrolase YtcJ
MRAVITRTSETAEIVQQEQRITPMEAIRFFIINAAYALFEEKPRGSIEPGKLADPIIIPDNPLTMQVEKIKDVKPEMVIRGGRVAYQKR